MDYLVPMPSIACMAAAALLGFVLPLVLFLIMRRRFKAGTAPFFIGCAVFIVFALLVEGSINNFILKSDAGKTIQNNIWIYGIFGGLMAGLFEETGRYVAFKTVLNKKRGNDGNALMYGAGHGGFEAFYILSAGMISNIYMSVMINSGQTGRLTAAVTDPAALERLHSVFKALSQTAPATFLMSVVERIAAVAVHLSLSVLVWFAAKDGGQRFLLYPLALLLHMFVNASSVILASYVSNIWVVMAGIYIQAIAFVFIAVTVWKKFAAAGESPSL